MKNSAASAEFFYVRPRAAPCRKPGAMLALDPSRVADPNRPAKIVGVSGRIPPLVHEEVTRGLPERPIEAAQERTFMVSAIDSTRLLSAQYALANLRGADEQSSDTSSSPVASLLGDYGLDPDSASLLSNKALASLLDTMPVQDDGAETGTGTPNADVTSASFMAMLKQQLQAAVESEGDSGNAAEMLAALEAGTLTVTDPVEGVSISAWDVDDPDEADTTSKAGQTIDTDGWNGFLNDRLERNSNGTFAKENGNYIDKATGNYAYFGQIGSSYYYLTWPQPKAGTAEA
jgi:cation transport regulator ChaC